MLRHLLFFFLSAQVLAQGEIMALAEEPAKRISFEELGVEAQKQYGGDGIAIDANRARLKAAFQKLEGELTAEGLWLESTEDGSRFRVVASSVGRTEKVAQELPKKGRVSADQGKLTFARPGLVEEYRVSMDGVRQDFVVMERPAGAGGLEVTLTVDGASVAASGEGVQLTLAQSGREISYSRLKVTDAKGRELAARMEVAEKGIRIRVDDAEAAYPVRIDPTFSDADWVSMGDVPGADGPVYAMTTDSSGNLYIGGMFGTVKDTVASCIAKWDGTSWSSLGEGMNGEVYALAVADGQVYAGGNFNQAGGKSANRIAKWDGNAWSALGSGVGGAVNALAVSGNVVYAGGFFFTAGGQPASYIAQWNGTAWSPMGTGTNDVVSALVMDGTTLYAGGEFSQAGGQNALHVAKWDGTAWSALGAGVSDHVLELVVSGATLYAAGISPSPVGPAGSRVRTWNGTAWSVLGEITGIVNTLVVDGSDVYIGGYFASANSVPANNLAKWNGTAWSALGSGTNFYVYGLAMVDGDLYVGGDYSRADGKHAKNLARWDGASWHALGTGLDMDMRALAVSGTDIYVAGSLGPPNEAYVYHWDGTSWNALEGAFSGGDILALALAGTDLYVGGEFFSGPVAGINNIAKWNGTSWSSPGTGVNGSVRALTVSGNEVYAGGSFTTAGGQSANRVAKWDGTNWSALGAGTDGSVYALATQGGDLYAGGNFINAGGQVVNRIAKWNGASWAALGTGVDGGAVECLAVSGAVLYAGGHFSVAGGQGAARIAQWNGVSWSPLGTGTNSGVNALAVSGRVVYAGGGFSRAGTVQAVGGIALWNGTAWSALGSGTNGFIEALALYEDGICAAGFFTTAGGKVSSYVARTSFATEIELTGGGNSILSGSTEPSATNQTDFGTVNIANGALERTFTIHNTGTAELKLTGTPSPVAIAGSGNFTVTRQPPATVPPQGSVTFDIAFAPSATGQSTAIVSIANDDEDESPFTFAIQGSGEASGSIAFANAVVRVNQGATSAVLTVTRTGGGLPCQVTVATNNGTSSVQPPFTGAVAGTDFVALTGAAATVAFAKDETSKVVTLTLITNSNAAEPNKRFSVALSAPSNGATLGAASTSEILILANDAMKPTLTLATPAAGKVGALSPYLLTGTAGDAKGIDRVEVVLNGGAMTPAVLGATTKPTAVPFSLVISPLEGANTVVVTAYDLKGNPTTVTRSFSFTRRFGLTLTRNDSAAGTVMLSATPGTAASTLTPTAASSNPKTSLVVAGTAVKLTATPKSGFVFKQWLGLPGGATVLGDVASFVMPGADMAVTAEFVATPFTGAVGSFYGLIHASAPTVSSNATEGFLTGTLTATGGFTGKVYIDGAAQAVTAVFFGDGAAVFTAGGKKLSSLPSGGKTLTLGFDFGANAVEATVTKGSDVSEGSAKRAIYSTGNKTRAALLNSTTKGSYTMSLGWVAPDGAAASTYPRGSGYATIGLTNVGVVSVAGVLADGSAITAGTALVSGDEAPMLAQLPTPGAAATVKGGSVSGTLVFDPGALHADVTAPLRWFRPVAVGTKVVPYANGWPLGIDLDGLGELYDKSLKVQPALNLGPVDPDNGHTNLLFADGKLNPHIDHRLNINGNTVLKMPAGNTAYMLTLTPATGLFSGSFTPNWANPAAAKPGFKGVLLQGDLKGGTGFFISNAKNDAAPEAGSVTLFGK